MQLDEPTSDRFTESLRLVIRQAVRVLAVLMTLVIVFGVIDVGWTLYERLSATPRFILTIGDMLATFGAFMAVLIAIEIFINITIYLREDVIHVKIVMATALMAVARKIIILDLNVIEAPYLWGLASVVFAMSIGYWIVVASAPVIRLKPRADPQAGGDPQASPDTGQSSSDR